jgi:hypothetical protein
LRCKVDGKLYNGQPGWQHLIPFTYPNDSAMVWMWFMFIMIKRVGSHSGSVERRGLVGGPQVTRYFSCTLFGASCETAIMRGAILALSLCLLMV